MAISSMQFKRGTTAQNNAYTGLPGELTLDTEAQAMRIHDGVTAGGHVMSGSSTLLIWDGAVTEQLGTHAEGAAVSLSMQAHSAFGDETIAYSVTGTLPPGLTLNSSNKAAVTLAGTIAQHLSTATYGFTVSAWDGYTLLEQSFTLTVSASNNVPVWSTGATLGTWDTSVSVQLAATDPEGQTLSYSLLSGTLPTGVTLSSTGLLSGTLVKDGLTYNFTVAVSDGTNSVSRAFSVVTQSPLPGASVLANGTSTLGFYGEVATSSLITGDALATAIGLSAGTSQFSSEPWLKYSMDGQVRFVAKKPFRYNLSWEQLYQAGAVYGDGTNGTTPSGTARTQNAIVTIAGVQYRVRLMRGGNANPTANTNGYDVSAGAGSEWNRLFYRLHSTAHTDASNSTATEGSPVPWVNYSDADLHMHYNYGNGTYCWALETHGASTSFRVNRGYSGVSYLGGNTAATVHAYAGWRPVLVPIV
jgi:hypothetical protein